MIKGRLDSVLVKMGREYGVPRGFPIVWQPKSSIRTFGFYPKFEQHDEGKSQQFFDQVL